MEIHLEKEQTFMTGRGNDLSDNLYSFATDKELFLARAKEPWQYCSDGTMDSGNNSSFSPSWESENKLKIMVPGLSNY